MTIARKMLENLGASVETAENGALGVEAMQAKPLSPSAIIAEIAKLAA